MDKEIEPIISISIIPFTSEIVGADEKFVYLREEYSKLSEAEEQKVASGKVYESEDTLEVEYNPCVIKVGRADFMEMIELWLSRKAEYTKLWGHFCGVMGNFYIDKHLDRGKINLLTKWDELENDEVEPVYEDVPVYEVVEFNKHCDMEHG